jgi:hypothetical protein
MLESGKPEGARRAAGVLVLLVAAWVAPPAFAQPQQGGEEGARGEAAAPSGVPLGPLTAHPGVDLQFGRNDNLLLQPSNPVKSNVLIASPFVRLEGKTGPQSFDFGYRGDFARYEHSRDDDYRDHLLHAGGALVFGEGLDLRLRAEQIYGHDARGTTDRAISTEPDRYRQPKLSALVGYGGRDAQGRIELDVAETRRRYQNNRAVTEASDRDTTDAGATFYWRVAPKTRALFQLRSADIDYTLEAVTLDSTEKRYYVGVQWDAAAKTSGVAKVGRMKKDFDSPSRAGVSSGSWDVGLRWAPLSYSVAEASTSRSFTESTGLGDTLLTARHNVAWTHGWSSRVSHALTYARIRDDFVGASRRDSTDAYGVKLNYQFRRSLRFGLEYSRTVRDSNDPAFEYTRNLVFLSASLAL